MSLKNKAGATYNRFVSECERTINRIDAKRKLTADYCTSCGQHHLILTMTGDGYMCDPCLDHQASHGRGIIEINRFGRVWRF